LLGFRETVNDVPDFRKTLIGTVRHSFLFCNVFILLIFLNNDSGIVLAFLKEDALYSLKLECLSVYASYGSFWMEYDGENTMKKIFLTTLLVITTSTVALAEWLVDFKDSYSKVGIDQAVVEAMKEGATPDAIVQNGLKLEGLNPQNLIKALYCAGAKGDDIKAAAQQYEISELILVAGYKKSVEECADQVVDSQAYTPVAGPSFAGVPAPGDQGASFASPSTF
jgi:hypothetical protein